MRRLLGISSTLALLAIGGCPEGPDAETAGASARNTDVGGYGWAIPCFNPDTSEFDPNCPPTALQEAIAILRQMEQEDRVDDIDLDGIPNEDDPDVDGDGVPNRYDLDVDGDGLMNGRDPDIDGDGKSGRDDPDEDGDGLSDLFDLNDDGDGLFDDEDTDDDGDGKEDDEDEDEPEDDEEEEEEEPLDDLVEKLRQGKMTDEDRARIAKEITNRLDNPRVNDIVLKAIQDLGMRSVDLFRNNDGSGLPPEIEAVRAVYTQLADALDEARREARIGPGQPTTGQAVMKALGEFIPRLQSMDELSKSFNMTSIPELGRAVDDLRTGLGSPERVREFTQALTRSNAAEPIGVEEDLEMEKLVDGASMLGPAFSDTSGGDLLDAIRLFDSMVDSTEQLADALQDVIDLGAQGVDFADAVIEVADSLIGTIQP